MSKQACGSFGCDLPAGHNRGKADVPSNHATIRTATEVVIREMTDAQLDQAERFIRGSSKSGARRTLRPAEAQALTEIWNEKARRMGASHRLKDVNE